ncbi:hypothetical protein PQO01_18165 [Lentisphaera marina]|uniref:hypothetical protein n=1 Tax=Lentisphaera marina TaxID=1111041 RepID=UPI002365A942|nr:hypothetical protein [Lentisphaera marina]MDD7986877.1 hypothetical protein [Lentisphaera marina]
MKKLLKIKDKDSGIAIMFSLMMLAVFLVLGMGFSAYMSNIRRAAEYQKDFKVNKDIEDVLLYQIRLALKGGFDVEGEYSGSSADYYTGSLPEGAPSRFYGASVINNGSDNPIQKPDTTTDIHYAIWGIETSDSLHQLKDDEILFSIYDEPNDNIDATSYIDPDNFTSPNDASAYLGWQEHQDENNEVYAISTWALMGMSGRLDPATVDTDTTGASLTAQRAIGQNISEISVSNFITNGSAQAAISTNATSALPTFQKALRDADSATFDDSAYFSFFPLGSDYTMEMLNESDVLEQTDKSLTMHSTESPITLFDLSEIFTDNTITPEVIVGNSGSKPIIFLSDATSSVPETQRLQIAANIIDYIDGDNTASSDYPGTNPPTYVGNEKVPYINEVIAEVTCTWDDVDGEGDTLDFKDYKIKWYGELIDLYGSNIGGRFRITYDINIVNDSDSTVIENSSDQTFDLTLPASATPNYISANTTQTVNKSGASFQDIGGSTATVEITIKSVIFTDAGGTSLYDYAEINKSWSSANGDSEIIASNGTPFSISVECGEPKDNLNSNNWVRQSTGGVFSGGAYGTPFTVGQLNAEYAVNRLASSNKDNEPSVTTDPLSASTNYIRNAPIKNLHELGYIHRGDKHQTLNLIEYKTESPEKIGNYTNGNGDLLYNSTKTFESLSNGGDRSILDYVSLGLASEIAGSLEETTPNRGRINPNTNHPAVLKALFSGISADHPSTNTDYVGSSGTVIGDGLINSLISNFPGINSNRIDLPYHGAGDDFPVIGYFDPLWFKNLKNNPPSYGVPFKLTTTLNDREAEVLIGNTRRFVSVNRNYYIASLAVDSTSSSADDGVRNTSIPCTQQYLVRELIDDSKDSSDSTATPHDPSDDRYRVRILR